MGAWMTNPTDGSYALIEQDAVDPWRVRGWQPATNEPTHKTMVWLHHEASGGQAQFPAGVVEQWMALGWKPGAPTEPIDLTKDPRLTDQPAEAAPEITRTATGRQTKRES
jgi:hypothetical protein